ncbi:MAG: hypothetical protein AAF578_06355 [Pseudomonadota bacterium]
MTNSSLFLRLLFVLVVGLLSRTASAQTLFEDDFESGDFAAGPSPVYAWRPAPTASNTDSHMMRGVDDVYSVSTERAYRGRYAMKLQFDGRNGFCNACGTTRATLNATSASTGCFTPEDSGPFGGSVYNVSNGWSQWQVTSVTGNQVCIDTSTAMGESVFQNTVARLSAGDDLRVPYQCGVNGNVGGSPGRRSDCNRAINYLLNVRATDVDYGETLSRRFYIYMPSQATLPDVTFKLSYTAWQRPGRSSQNAKLKLSTQRDLQITLNAPDGENIVVRDSNAQRDAWFYFEELFIRESSPGASDGTYRIYMGPATAPFSELLTPIYERNDVEMGVLRTASVMGNWQHFAEVTGSVYVDDVVIAKSLVGPVGFDPDEPPAERVNDLN